MVTITKVDGRKEEFERKKVYGTCIRSGVPEEVAERISKEVEEEVYEGISSKKILDMVLEKLDKYKKHHSLLYNLKKAIADLDPKESEFEKYVRHILKEHGYETRWDEIIQGECIEHQIDVVAEKDDKKYIVECKHHVNPHRFCGLGTALQSWAVIDDLQEGYEAGKTPEKFDNMWLVTNTKYSKHAINYSKAKGMLLTGWAYPKERDLRDYIQEKGLYPVTLLDVSEKRAKKFSSAGILLLRDIADKPADKLNSMVNIKEKDLKDIRKTAKKVIKSG